LKFLVKNYENLPEKIKQRCELLDVKPIVFQQYSELLWRIEDFPPETYKNLEGSRKSVAPKSVMDPISEKGRVETKLLEKSVKSSFTSRLLIGEGSYCKGVFRYKDNNRQKKCGIKKIDHNHIRSKEKNWAEIGFLSSCSHKNIISFFCAYLCTTTIKNGYDEEVWIVSEFVKGVTLSQAVKYYAFKDVYTAFIIHEVLAGLSYLHSKNWAHRDIKSTNIMLSRNGEVKLVDFGLCTDMTSGPELKMLGSPYWIPPEMINKKPHHLSADIWSLAVCILEILLRAPPYSSSPILCMFNVGTVGLQKLIPKNISEQLQDVLVTCLQQDNTKRPTAIQLLKHDWFKRQFSRREFAITCDKIFLSSSLNA